MGFEPTSERSSVRPTAFNGRPSAKDSGTLPWRRALESNQLGISPGFGLANRPISGLAALQMTKPRTWRGFVFDAPGLQKGIERQGQLYRTSMGAATIFLYTS